MENLEARISSLLRAPAGRAFLLLAARSGLAPVQIGMPRVSLEIAAAALGEVSLWRVDRAAVFAELDRVSEGELADLARSVLTSPGAEWWFQALRRSSQMWLSTSGSAPLAARLVTPSRSPTSWESYAQKPADGFFTSTLIEGTSAVHAELASGSSDFVDRFQSGHRTCWRLVAAPDARICEIDGPEAWHSLCVRHRAHGPDGRLVPDWTSVARDFDAVHLTLGGLLTGQQVRISSSAGWTARQVGSRADLVASLEVHQRRAAA
jgi:hypothetical protein